MAQSKFVRQYLIIYAQRRKVTQRKHFATLRNLVALRETLYAKISSITWPFTSVNLNGLP